MKLSCLLLRAIVLLVLVLTTGWAVEFDHQYSGSSLPEESFPAWSFVQKEGTIASEGNVLHLQIPTNERRNYMMGLDARGTVRGDGEAWNLKGGKAVIEFRLRCEGDASKLPIFTVILRDGETQWHVAFTRNSINSVPADTREWDTYRLTIKDGLMSLSSENKGTIIKGSQGFPDERGNIIMFGTYSYAQDDPIEVRQWWLEYIRWTHQ